MKRYKYLKSQDKLSIQIFIIVWITISVLLTLYPVFITIINSLKSDYSIRASIFPQAHSIFLFAVPYSFL